MRKLLFCLTLIGASLSLDTAQAQLRPLCSAYCCATSTATSSSPCWLNGETQTTCGAYWFNHSCP